MIASVYHIHKILLKHIRTQYFKNNISLEDTVKETKRGRKKKRDIKTKFRIFHGFYLKILNKNNFK